MLSLADHTLYHGATTVVRNPLTHVGRPELDFGPGFYLTNDRDQAIRWAHVKASRARGQKAYLNVYHFDLEAFESDTHYHLRVFSSYDNEWLDFISFSRKGRRPWTGLDWIEGGIANDSVISTVDAYVDGLITVEKALDELVNEELRHQVCISNQEIIDKYLTFNECITI